MYLILFIFFFQAEDGIRDLVRSRGLGDVYKRQKLLANLSQKEKDDLLANPKLVDELLKDVDTKELACLLYTSDAADERSSVDLGGRRIIKKKTNLE